MEFKIGKGLTFYDCPTSKPRYPRRLKKKWKKEMINYWAKKHADIFNFKYRSVKCRFNAKNSDRIDVYFQLHFKGAEAEAGTPYILPERDIIGRRRVYNFKTHK